MSGIQEAITMVTSLWNLYTYTRVSRIYIKEYEKYWYEVLFLEYSAGTVRIKHMELDTRYIQQLQKLSIGTVNL